jgi:uncharacterized protein (UPF0147 family)
MNQAEHRPAKERKAVKDRKLFKEQQARDIRDYLVDRDRKLYKEQQVRLECVRVMMAAKEQKLFIELLDRIIKDIKVAIKVAKDRKDSKAECSREHQDKAVRAIMELKGQKQVKDQITFKERMPFKERQDRMECARVDTVRAIREAKDLPAAKPHK